MYSLPTTVTIKDTEFHITNQGDFRMVLDCFGALNDVEMGEDLRVLAALIIFYEEFDDLLDVQEYADYIEDLGKEMFRFINCGQDDSPGAVTSTPLIDWDKDSQIVCAAVNNVANQEIRSLPYLHWWTFMGYFLSVGDSVLSTVCGIRNKIVKGKKLEKWEKDFKRDNPNYFKWRRRSIEEESLENAIRELWNNGGGNNGT